MNENETRHGPSPLLPWIFLLVTVALAGAGVWFALNRWAAQNEAATRSAAAAFEKALDRRDAEIATLTERNRELSVELATAVAKSRELAGRVQELANRVEHLERLNAGLREGQADRDGLERDKARLAGAVVRLEDELASARRELKTARGELLSQLERIAKLENAAEGAPTVEEPAKPPEEIEPAPIPAGAVTDEKELARVKSVLNQLLVDTAGGAYRIAKIGGLRGKTLYGVEIVDGRAGGRATKTIQAREASIVIDPARSRVEFRLADGSITYYGVRARFVDDRYVLPLTDVSTQAWVRSGLTIFETI